MSSTPLPKRSNLFNRLINHGDRPWRVLIVGMALLVLVLMLAIGWSVWSQSEAARAQFGLDFIKPTTDSSWDPINNQFQAWPIITGTLITSLIAILVATPISIFIAVFLSELCPDRLRTPLNFMVEMLAAIPSVVYGLWGIFVFLPDVVTPVGQFLGETLGMVPIQA